MKRQRLEYVVLKPAIYGAEVYAAHQWGVAAGGYRIREEVTPQVSLIKKLVRDGIGHQVYG